MTHPTAKAGGFLVQQPLHSSHSQNVLHDFPKRRFPLVQRYVVSFKRLYLPRLWLRYCVPRLYLYCVLCHNAGRSIPLRKGLWFPHFGSRIHGMSDSTDRMSVLSGFPNRRALPCTPIDGRTRSMIRPR